MSAPPWCIESRRPYQARAVYTRARPSRAGLRLVAIVEAIASEYCARVVQYSHAGGLKNDWVIHLDRTATRRQAQRAARRAADQWMKRRRVDC